MPWFERLADFDLDSAWHDGSIFWKPEFKMGIKPLLLQRVAILLKVVDDLAKIFSNEMWQHEPIVKRGTPANQLLLVRILPESSDESPQQQLLRETHPRVRRHLKCPQFQEPE